MKDLPLRFKEVNFRFTKFDKEVINNISLEIEAGKVTAILGPNGAGKTTLLYLALGWLRTQGGSVLLANRPVNSHSNRERGQWMSLVPQKEQLSFEYSLIEYVLLGRSPYLNPLQVPGFEDYRIAAHTLEQVGLSEIKNKAITTLSGGERQLLLVARALAQQPRIFLLDEPTAHLDLKNKRKIMNLLHELRSRGKTIILTTHEPEVTASIADTVVLMNEGNVIESGPLDQVLTGEKLSTTYGTPIRVIEVEGKRVVLWI